MEEECERSSWIWWGPNNFVVSMETHEFWIPSYMMEGINRYVQFGNKPGSFLSAVIMNDLKMAVLCADKCNIQNLPAYIYYFQNHVPSRCWGSRKKMIKWIGQGGLEKAEKEEI